MVHLQPLIPERKALVPPVAEKDGEEAFASAGKNREGVFASALHPGDWADSAVVVEHVSAYDAARF